jgi:hypothetical protein
MWLLAWFDRRDDLGRMMDVDGCDHERLGVPSEIAISLSGRLDHIRQGSG